MPHLRSLLIALCLCMALPVFAQSGAAPESGPNYATWESVASRAETAIDGRSDASSVFETLRTRIAGFRKQFEDQRGLNAERIATLRSQIEALGPVPENGAEDEDTAARRAELSQQLTALLAPVRAADEAFTRADGLIGEIDQIIRERETERLLALGPSPINPANWPGAVQELGTAMSDLAAERRVFRDEQLLAGARENMPLVLLLSALGIVLLTRGRRWAAVLGDWLRDFGGRGTGVWSFVVSLGRIVLPLAGLLALSEAIFASGLVGLRGTAVLEALPIWGLVLLGHRWLSERLFSRDESEAILEFPKQRRSEARFYIVLMALLLVLRGALELVDGFSDLSSATVAVLAFPIIVLTGLMLFRLGQILRSYSPSYEVVDETSEEELPPRSGLGRMIRWLGLGSMIVAVAAPVMAGIGYTAAGSSLLYPMVLTLSILGLVLALQRFGADIYGWLSGQGASARDSLIPILIGFVLILLSLPLLALIWGARLADLSEIWSALLRGFTIGETTISPTDFIVFAAIFAAGYVVTRLFQTALRSSVLPKTTMDAGARNAIVSGVGYVGIFLAAVMAITGAGIDLSSLAIVAGALSVGIGFGLQNIVSNFVSGIILLIERPISEGDWIEVGGQQGYVRGISVRSTRIETFDRSDVIIPNADLVSGTVTNFTRGNTVGRAIVPVGVAYGTDTRKVSRILQEIAEAHPMVLMRPPPSVVFAGLGASSLDFEIRAILRDVNWLLTVKTELLHQIVERFAEEGIEVPFAQRDIWLRNPEALMGGGEKAKDETEVPKEEPTPTPFLGPDGDEPE